MLTYINDRLDQIKRIENLAIALAKGVKIYYIVEGSNWSIKQDGHNIVGHLHNLKGTVCTSSWYIPKNAIRHYGSFNVFFGDKHLRKDVINIVTCFHIVDGDPRAAKIKELDEYVTLWHTSCMITKKKLIHYGVTENKIVVIPLGVDTSVYKPLDNAEEREKRRAQFGIKQEQLVIGSFQKDGNGWDDGNIPKLIKGPDIFCDLMEQLAKKYDVFALLSGPARGYVKNRLKAAGIPYHHEYFENASEVAKLYPLIDIYTVTSREEGGPKAILESMASGVPIITTKVGMAPDIVENGKNGLLIDCEDLKGLVNAVDTIYASTSVRKAFIKQGKTTSEGYSMDKIAKRYEEELYHYAFQKNK